MLQDIKNTLKQSAIYGLSRISVKFVAVILTPIITSYFSVSEYGILDRFERFWQIIYAISLFGAETALLRWYILLQSESKKKTFLFTITTFLISVNIILIISALLFNSQISYLIFDSTQYKNVVIYTFLIACFEALLVIPLSILRAKNKPKLYLVITLSSTLLSLFLQLFALYYFQNKLPSLFIAKSVAPFLIFLILIPFLLKYINFKFDFEFLREILKFCFPLVLVGIVSNLLNSVNRFILGFLGQQYEVGLFSMASNISGIITFLLISPFQLTFNSIFWQKLSDENAGRFYTKSMTYSVFCYIWGAITLSVLIPFIIKIFIPYNTDYWKSTQLVPILSMSLVFYGMQVIAFMSYHHDKRNDLIFYFQTGALLLNISMCYLLIPHYGMYGASISILVSYIALISTMYYFSKRFYFIQYETSKIIIMILLGFIMIYIPNIINVDIKIINILLRLFIIFLFPVILYFLKFYDKIEIATVRNIVKNYFKKK